MKDGAHSFKLGGSADVLLFVCVCEHYEVLSAHLKPVIYSVPGRGR